MDFIQISFASPRRSALFRAALTQHIHCMRALIKIESENPNLSCHSQERWDYKSDSFHISVSNTRRLSTQDFY